MIWGSYDAKSAGKGADGKPKGFVPGGASLHSCMSPHGPDAGTHAKASKVNGVQQPHFFDKGLAFMFETTYMLKMSEWALEEATGIEITISAGRHCHQSLHRTNSQLRAGPTTFLLGGAHNITLFK